jgi:hypothetical protein
MGDKDHCLAALLKGFHTTKAFLLEPHISHTQRLIHNQNIRIHLNGHCKGQPDKHPARVSSDLLMDKFSNICKPKNIMELVIDLLF